MLKVQEKHRLFNKGGDTMENILTLIANQYFSNYYAKMKGRTTTKALFKIFLFKDGEILARKNNGLFEKCTRTYLEIENVVSTKTINLNCKSHFITTYHDKYDGVGYVLFLNANLLDTEIASIERVINATIKITYYIKDFDAEINCYFNSQEYVEAASELNKFAEENSFIWFVDPQALKEKVKRFNEVANAYLNERTKFEALTDDEILKLYDQEKKKETEEVISYFNN